VRPAIVVLGSGLLVVSIPVSGEDGGEDVIISGRVGDRLAFAFGGPILTKRIEDAFNARVEAH